ncbi:MAG: UvrD-helicase domain-containing protein, partial [Sedimentisphaerales bacterium]|nr:UvrD-helicase domain-containing protein [Sedimentisphaerales bacterium]
MAEKKIKWTDQQQRAIEARGSDILVTASAGTGKTAVLSGRCVEIASDKSLCQDVRSILVLTFTEAAAEEMRSRITTQLRDIFLQNPDNHIRRQLMLLQGADISTIHSFCKRLITEYFYKLGLDPTFSVIDGDEQKLLKTEALEKTIDWAWQQSNLQAALEQLLYRRDLRPNDGFLTKIIYISDFLDGVVSRRDWYEKAAHLADAVNPFTTDIGEKQKQIVADKLRDTLARIQYAVKLYENDNPGGKWAMKWNETFVEPVTAYIKLIKCGSWDKFSKEIRNYQKPSRYEYKPRGLSGPVADIIKSVAEEAKKSFEELCDLAILNPNYLDSLSGSVGLQTKVLIELVKKFAQLYSQAKRTLNCLDFADLEHYALKLLTAEDSSQDQIKPSETAIMLREKYKYIFVDEYQDINSVQQCLLEKLSPGGNVLEVGDVKQSIYAFRGAQPDIFLEQLKHASGEIEKAQGGLRVDLNLNFRSAKGILDFVNKIFSRIMTDSFAKIDYDESHKLKPGNEDESQGGTISQSKPVVEFHMLDEIEKGNGSDNEMNNEPNGDEKFSLITNRQSQAAMIARR